MKGIFESNFLKVHKSDRESKNTGGSMKVQMSSSNILNFEPGHRNAMHKRSTWFKFRKWMSESSTFIFHQDFKIRKVCLMLCEKPETIEKWEEMKQSKDSLGMSLKMLKS